MRPSQERPIQASRCKLCEGYLLRRLFEKNGFSIVQCRRCRLLFADPSPTPEYLKQFYEEGYSGGSYQVLKEATEAYRRSNFQRRLKRLQFHRGSTRPGRLLDVGCGAGLLLEVAQQIGWDIRGVELSQGAVEQAPEAIRRRIHLGIPSTAPFPEASFDVVSMLDFIEHCIEPLADLRAAHRLLKDRGLLMLTTPNFSSMPARLMGRHYTYLYPPDHLVYFSPRTIRVALEKTGFETLEVRRAYKSFTLAYIAAKLPYTNPVAHRWVAPLVKWIPPWIANRPLALYVGEMLVIARKSRR